MKVLLVTLVLVAAAKALNVGWKDIEMIVKPAGIVPTNKFNERIIGGREAIPHSIPFQAFLTIYSKGSCGGSLISRKSVLTAAHCLTGAKKVEVILGAHNLAEIEPSQVRYNSTHFIIHPYYIKTVNDIAIVILPESVMLNENISLVSLPSTYNSFTNKIVNVSGWGQISDANKTIVFTLRYTTSNVITDAECKKTFYIIPSIHICSNGKEGKGTCSGDSGGPLTIENNGKVIQIGVVSFGHITGCEKGYPSVYTRVTAYLDWIAANTGVTINYIAVDQQQLLMLFFLIFIF